MLNHSSQKMIYLGRKVAIAIITLGIIHDVATFTPLITGGLTCLSPNDYNAMIYMSLICGTSFILSGTILIILLKKVEEFTFLSSTILLIGGFLAASGILSTIYMYGNPFAWIALVLNLSMFTLTIGLKLKLNRN